MCKILIRPTIDLVIDCLDQPDGIASVKKNKIKKNLNYDKVFLGDLVESDILHTRLSTRGEISIDNVHGFELSDGGYAFHNGVFYDFGNSIASDTADFIQRHNYNSSLIAERLSNKTVRGYWNFIIYYPKTGTYHQFLNRASWWANKTTASTKYFNGAFSVPDGEYEFTIDNMWAVYTTAKTEKEKEKEKENKKEKYYNRVYNKYYYGDLWEDNEDIKKTCAECGKYLNVQF